MYFTANSVYKREEPFPNREIISEGKMKKTRKAQTEKTVPAFLAFLNASRVRPKFRAP
jgi:hypothetical protein